MYRLLIVDDEPYIVDWISELMEVQLGTELEIYRAYSAFEALNWLDRARIDIMIADIHMPEMSGITLAQKVRQSWPGCKIIMLTAHAEFDYAFEAIKSNVAGYVLKTEDDERIVETVKKAVMELEREVKDLQLLNEARDRMWDSMSAIRNELILGILNGGNLAREDVIRNFKRLDMSLEVDLPFLLLAGKVTGIPGPEDLVGHYNYILKIKKVIHHYLSGHFQCVQVEYPGDRIVILMQPRTDGDASNKPEEYFITYTKGVLELVQKSLEETLNIGSSFVISSTLIAFEQLCKRFQQMLQVFAYHGEEETGAIMTDLLIEANEDVNSLSVLSLNLVQFINEYIEKNIMEDVSLIKLSEVTGYNPSYLSRLYKEIAHETLNEYISRVRFKKAKELLQCSKLTLNEIAAEIGLGSRTYFNRFIKKITGMSPQEYRDHLNESKHRIQK